MSLPESVAMPELSWFTDLLPNPWTLGSGTKFVVSALSAAAALAWAGSLLLKFWRWLWKPDKDALPKELRDGRVKRNPRELVVEKKTPKHTLVLQGRQSGKTFIETVMKKLFPIEHPETALLQGRRSGKTFIETEKAIRANLAGAAEAAKVVGMSAQQASKAFQEFGEAAGKAFKHTYDPVTGMPPKGAPGTVPINVYVTVDGKPAVGASVQARDQDRLITVPTGSLGLAGLRVYAKPARDISIQASVCLEDGTEYTTELRVVRLPGDTDLCIDFEIAIPKPRIGGTTSGGIRHSQTFQSNAAKIGPVSFIGLEQDALPLSTEQLVCLEKQGLIKYTGVNRHDADFARMQDRIGDEILASFRIPPETPKYRKLPK
jgi:hypothetical protein